jgi:hypothetical protein
MTTTCRHPTPRFRRRTRRRGFSSVASLLITVIGIATLMLVVNWTYLNLARTRTQQLAETLAFSAVPRLLDDEVLEDALPYSQPDDIADTTSAIFAPTTGLLDQNNAASGPTLQVEPADVTLTFGRVNDANSPVVGANFSATPVPGEPYNTLRVEIYRPASGANPVQLFIRGMGSPNAATISGASYATLDSRVLAFRPTATIAAPVAPLALDSAAWFSDRPTAAVDSNGNARLELRARLRTNSGFGDFNAALISMDSTAAMVAADIPDQVEDGIFPGDVDGSGMFGPATAADPLATDAERNSPANVSAIRDAFNTVAASSYPRRVFPIYSGGYSDPLDITGFIGARVLGASLQTVSGESRLVVRLEPEFVIHSTVVTAFEDATTTEVPENLYVHKIRLTR